MNIITDSGNNINLSVDNSTLAITRDDITFKGQSLIVDTSNFVINGITDDTVNIKTTGAADINLTTGSGDVNILSGFNVKLAVKDSVLTLTDTDVTYKGQSLIVDTSNFIVNDYEKELSFTEGTINTGTWNSICYGNGMFVAVSNGKCAWSTDGKTFTEGTINTGTWNSVCYGNGMFVAVSNAKCAWSTDGKTFTDGTIGTGTWYGVCYGNGMFVAVSNINKSAWSTDGKTFTDGTIGTGTWGSVCYGNGMFVAVGSSKCAWSTDGKTFTDGTIGTGTWSSVCYGNSMFVAVGSSKCAWSTDGKTFTNGTITSYTWRCICYGNGMFVAVSYSGKCAWSTDDKTFTNGTILNESWYGVCYGNRMLVAVSQNGKCAWSEFGIVTAKSFALKEEMYTKTEVDDKFVINGISDKNIDLNGFGTFQVSTYNSIDLTVDSNNININQNSIVISGQKLDIKIPSDTVNNSITINTEGFIFYPYGYFNLRLDLDSNCGITINRSQSDIINAKSCSLSANGTSLNLQENSLLLSARYIGNLLTVNSTDILYKQTSLLNTSATITHKAPIDENLTQEDFEIGKPVYMTGKVYVKDKSSETGWKHSESIDDVIDCISSVKHTGTWREYLGICVGKYKTRVGLEENEITFASHGDFMVKYSKCNVGDTLYVTDDGNINVLNDETPLTLKIQRQIIGLVTEKINDEYCAVFKSN